MNPVLKNNLSISSLSIDSGPYNTEVVINGAGFNTTSSNDLVYFDGVAATVLNATSSELLVLVPLAAGTGNVTIKVNGVTATGPVFIYQQQEVVTLIAGNNNPGAVNGTGAVATFFQPDGITVDGTGNLYISDLGNNLIRKISSTGEVSTFAGSGASGTSDGTGTTASFNHPTGIATDGTGNVYVADALSGLIRKITQAGVVSTLAGGAKGTSGQDVDGTGATAYFSNPVALAVDGSGNVFVSDAGSGRIRKITPEGVVTTIYSNGGLSCYGIALDNLGNIYATDVQTNNIFKITQSGVSVGFAGNGNQLGGNFDGTGNAASFSMPYSMTIDKNGNLYVCDLGNMEIRKITPGATVTTIAGEYPGIFSVGVANKVPILDPAGVTVDKNGNIFILDGNQVQEISVQ